MADTMQAEMPGEGWTLHGVAYCQIAIARDDLVNACGLIRAGDSVGAVDMLSTTIRQLEAARRHLA